MSIEINFWQLMLIVTFCSLNGMLAGWNMRKWWTEPSKEE